tara:strand:+ start:263 stop:394 length:132 start_codon:yes stop_codon:yes gene_type:complete
MYELSSEQRFFGQIIGYGLLFISLSMLLIAYRFKDWIEMQDKK